jgi:hypothetical protein
VVNNLSTLFGFGEAKKRKRKRKRIATKRNLVAKKSTR